MAHSSCCKTFIYSVLKRMVRVGAEAAQGVSASRRMKLASASATISLPRGE